MTRWWIDLVAAIGDVMSLPIVVLLMFLAATIVAVLWYSYPAWLPRRFGGQGVGALGRSTVRRLFRLRRRPRRGETAGETPGEPDEPAADELPDLPAATLLSLADRLRAEGRYAEAVRERLRAIVRDLVDRQVIEHLPGWTVTELAGTAAAARPEVGAPLDQAAALFSHIWYGMHPAYQEHDDQMRELVVAVGAAVDLTTTTGVRP